MKKIIILGNSGNTPDIIDAIRATHGLECFGILDDDSAQHGESSYGVKVLGPLDTASTYTDCHFVNGIHGIGSHKIKDTIIAGTGCPNDRFVSIIHPTAFISPSAVIEDGTVILANVTVCANARIGRHCIVLPNSVINHDVVLDDYVALASSVSLAGCVRVGSLSYIGAGAMVRERLTIGEKSLVAMGAVVVKDVLPGTTVMGCPAKSIQNGS